MKFSQYPLNVPNINKIQKQGESIIKSLKEASNVEEAIAAVNKMNEFSSELSTDMTVISVRYSIDTTDETYIKANDVLDEIIPYISAIMDEYGRALDNSQFKEQLIDEYGEHLFNIIKNNLKTFSPEIIEDLQEENKIMTKYSQLLANGKVEFRGNTYTLTQIGRFMRDLDRQTRKEANEVYWGWYDEHEEELGQIYDDLVKLRHKMANKLGFETYVPLGYFKMGRLDYGPEDVAIYRNEIKAHVTPLYKKLRKRQAKRIKINNPAYYDYSLNFLSGNAKPAGDSDYLVNAALNMYNEMDKEIGEFFNMMVEKGLLDLDAK